MAKSIKERTHLSAIVTQPSDTVADVVFGWIAERYAEQRNAAKKLAAFASTEWHSVSHRTTARWLTGKAAPSMTSTEIMAARCDDLAERVRKQREALRARIR